MDDRKPRHFHLIDAVALLAATAAGLGMAWVVTPKYATAAETVIDVAVCLVASWTLALLTLNLTRNRTTLRDLAGRPGFSAGIAFVVWQGSKAVSYAIMFPYMAPLWPRVSLATIPAVTSQLLFLLVVNTPFGGGCRGAVAGVWMVMAMAGCWRPEKTWIDRMGRAIGVFWLGIGLVSNLATWAFPGPILEVPDML